MNRKVHSKGFILPIAIIFSLIGLGITLTFITKTYNEKWRVDVRIATAKASYNAETGFVVKGFKEIVKQDFEDSLLTFNDKYPVSGMGGYTDVIVRQYTNDNNRIIRSGSSVGYSKVKSILGKELTIKERFALRFDPISSLARYMYLTDDEKAGGAPFVFQGDDRRNVTFGTGDVLGGGNIQTNGTFVMSDYGCPEFQNTVWLTKDSDGNVNSPDMGGCNPNQVFQGDPPLDTMKTVCLPPPGYERMKTFANYEFDATAKMKWAPGSASRDTLIMTEIIFYPDDRVSINQWWYLMPPHLNIYAGDIQTPTAQHLSGYNPFGSPCDANDDLRTCEIYEEDMNNYHAKYISSSGTETLMNPKIRGTHGFHHFDFEPTSTNIVPGYPIEISVNKPLVLYVKGGPVRVKGIYSGQYTVVTDEFVPYRRHAWPSNSSAPLDTVWCNIWITGDIRKSDSPPSGDLSNYQPDEDCVGGSDNIMGLVSGANVYVANTVDNGAGNNTNANVVIHAHIIAFNESFAMHYWQNTLGFGYSNPPYGDGRGPDLYGGTTGNSDIRGTVNLWGGIVQKYRGYMKRNLPGPYDVFPGVGMEKSYHYDENLMCVDPPLYPEDLDCSADSDEFDIKISNYYVGP